MNILPYMPWFWLALFVVLIIVEASTMALTTIWGAISALALVFLSLTKMPIWAQMLIFVVLAFTLFVTTRPLALKKFQNAYKTNLDSLIGQEIKITTAVSKFEKGKGETKNGVTWSVASEDDSPIGIDSVCKIIRVEGNTLIVKEEK